MKPTLETLIGLYRAALALGSPIALQRVRECIVRHGYSEARVQTGATATKSP